MTFFGVCVRMCVLTFSKIYVVVIIYYYIIVFL